MPTDDALPGIAARHGLAPADVLAAPLQGVANRVWFLGEGLVLRAAREEEPQAAEWLRKEAVVIPHAVAHGVRTPEMVDFDDSLRVLPVSFMVLRRAHGVVPELPGQAVGDPRGAVYRELGAELARLHGAGLPGDPAGVIPVEAAAEPRHGVERLAAAGYFSTADAGWLMDVFERLAARIPEAAPRLIHGDVSPTNLLADPATGRLTALLDWGDAALADPASDFAKLPLRAAPYALEGYLGPVDEELQRAWAARVLWHHLYWAVCRIPSGPDKSSAHWSARPASRLLEVLRFYAEGAPEVWRP